MVLCIPMELLWWPMVALGPKNIADHSIITGLHSNLWNYYYSPIVVLWKGNIGCHRITIGHHSDLWVPYGILVVVLLT